MGAGTWALGSLLYMTYAVLTAALVATPEVFGMESAAQLHWARVDALHVACVAVAFAATYGRAHAARFPRPHAYDVVPPERGDHTLTSEDGDGQSDDSDGSDGGSVDSSSSGECSDDESSVGAAGTPVVAGPGGKGEQLPRDESQVKVCVWDASGAMSKRVVTLRDMNGSLNDKISGLYTPSVYHRVAPWLALVIASTPLAFRLVFDSHSCGAGWMVRWVGVIVLWISGLSIARGVQAAMSKRQLGFRLVQLSVTMVLLYHLSWGLFAILANAERALHVRFLAAKYFCAITSRRRARRGGLPYLSLHRVAHIKMWLSLRALVRVRGPLIMLCVDVQQRAHRGCEAGPEAWGTAIGGHGGVNDVPSSSRTGTNIAQFSGSLCLTCCMLHRWCRSWGYRWSKTGR